MIGAFLSRRARRYALFAVGVPVTAWALGKLGDEVEHRRGKSRLTETLASAQRLLSSRAKGPLADRLTASK